jgi:hypothetical protein
MQLPAFDESKYKFFDVNWDAPMNTISGITEWSRDINDVYAITTWICIFVFFAVAIPLVWTLVKFKDKGDGIVPKQFHGNATLEILWTVLPVVLLLFIAVPTWRVLFKHAHAPENAIVVEVIGHQWWWEFRYPQNGNIITANELHLPEKTPIHFKVWSEDVIHGFWIPKFGGKMDANPTGMNEDGSPKRFNDLYFETPAVVDASKKGGDMYDKFAAFADDLLKLGAQMDTSKKTYEEAMKKLSTGTGNLVKRASDLKKLGLNSGKNINPLLSAATEEE